MEIFARNTLGIKYLQGSILANYCKQSIYDHHPPGGGYPLGGRSRCAHTAAARSGAQAEDRQVQRNQDRHDHASHHDQDDRFDQAHCRGEVGLHVFLKELGNRVQHLRQRAGRFADLDHLDGEFGKHLRLLQARRQSLAFAHRLHAGEDRLADLLAVDRSRRRFQARHQRQTAFQQSRQGPREEADLVLQPDIADQRQPDADLVHQSRARIRLHPAKQQKSRKREGGGNINSVALRISTQREQEYSQRGKLRPKLLVQFRKPRHNEGNQKDEQPDHHHHQHRGIDQTCNQLLAERQTHPLKVEVTLQHFFQISRALAGQQGRRINDRKTALRLERFRDRLAVLHPDRDIFELRTEVRRLLPPRQQFDRSQDRKSGANQRQKLLVEDQESLQFHFLGLALPCEQATRLHGVDVVTSLGKPCPQLLRRSRGVRLLLHAPTLIRQPDHELSHRNVLPHCDTLKRNCCLDLRRCPATFHYGFHPLDSKRGAGRGFRPPLPQPVDSPLERAEQRVNAEQKIRQGNRLPHAGAEQYPQQQLKAITEVAAQAEFECECRSDGNSRAIREKAALHECLIGVSHNVLHGWVALRQQEAAPGIHVQIAANQGKGRGELGQDAKAGGQCSEGVKLMLVHVADLRGHVDQRLEIEPAVERSVNAEIQQALHPGESVHAKASERDRLVRAGSAEGGARHLRIAETSPMQIDFEAGGGILVGEVFPVGAVERQPFGRKTVDPEHAAVSEVPQNLVGLDNSRLVDQEVDVSRCAQAKIAEDGLRERQAFQHSYRSVVVLKFFDDTPEFGQRAQHLMGTLHRKLPKPGKDCGEFRRWRVPIRCVQILRDQRHQAMTLDKEEKTLQVEPRVGQVADALAVFRPLGPTRAEQHQIQFRRQVGLPILRYIRGMVPSLLQVSQPLCDRYSRYIRAVELRMVIRLLLLRRGSLYRKERGRVLWMKQESARPRWSAGALKPWPPRSTTRWF